jgi:hypothetical protein
MTASTLLKITPVSPNTAFGLTPFSMREGTVSLDQWTGVDGDDAFGTTVQMTGNGKALDLSHPQFDLLQTTIGCTDVQSPMLNAGWRGALVQIDFPIERSYPVGGTADRPAVSGSTPRTANGIVYYRPTLLMRITMVKNNYLDFQHRYVWLLKAIETVSA